MNLNKKRIVFILLAFLAWRFGLQTLTAVADRVVPYAPTFPYSSTLLPQFTSIRAVYSWANFDGVHYLTIAEKGYKGTALIQAFFPLYPKLMSFMGSSNGNYLFSGLFISHVAALVSIFLLFALLKPYAQSNTRIRTVLLLFLFPTSFYFISLYTESLFLMVVLAAFLCAQKKHWLWAAVFAGLASATRVVGLAVVVALLVEYAVQKKWKLTIKDIPHLALISLGSLGLLCYMLYLYIVFHDPLLFLHVQSEFGGGRQESMVILPQVLWRALKILVYSDINWRWWTSLQEFVYTVAFFTTVLWAYIKKYTVPLSWLVFSILCLTLPTLTGNLSSMPRYVLTVFPVFFIWAGQRMSWQKWVLIFGLFIVGLVLNTILFLQGYWIA